MSFRQKVNLYCRDKQNLDYLDEIIYFGLVRSFGSYQVELVDSLDFSSPQILVSRTDTISTGDLQSLSKTHSKIILHGVLTVEQCELLGVQSVSLPKSLSECSPANVNQISESSGKIVYSNNNSIGSLLSRYVRPLVRYDFQDEWNNLGFGSVKVGKGPFDVSTVYKLSNLMDEVSGVFNEGESFGSFQWVQSFGNAYVYVCSRPALTFDSYEVAAFEEFISSFSHSMDFPCVASITDASFDYDLSVTMRLDCDESILSSQALFSFYRERDIPFSLAIKSNLEEAYESSYFFKEIEGAGGSLLSHSYAHLRNWGSDKKEATLDAVRSIKAFERFLPSKKIRRAVSPFHSNERYSVNALEEVGYRGFIAGSVSSAPEYSVFRGGKVPSDRGAIVTHSQQCMLHGDCLLEGSDPLKIPLLSAEIHNRCGAIFGYLDHPFSDRYQYGWESENARQEVHKKLLDTLERRYKVNYLSEDEVLDIFEKKDSIQIESGKDLVVSSSGTSFNHGVRFRGKTVGLRDLL
ncbi:MAG: hypothetical protein CL677_10020 [Bdellovibrionaceae bacterium]|nr:hypothetical protein [Pseudobdellovibrionaceae bacterium]|tara:strand:+ start:71186 stop:72745 length:1560 start_codon:yes stop_codon:yes gene_type:complete